jgi:isopentenyl-diphosphate delta-isomerase
MEEILDILNEKGEVIGTMSREDSETTNSIVRNAIVILLNPGGEIWIQKRAQTKKHYPGIWDVSAAGAIASGEDPLEAAQRELREEASIATALEFVEEFVNIFPNEDGTQQRTRLSHLYLGVTDQIPQPNEEVERFESYALSQLQKMCLKNPQDFVPSFLLEIEKGYNYFTEHKPYIL